jgi:hypothetical protein
VVKTSIASSTTSASTGGPNQFWYVGVVRFDSTKTGDVAWWKVPSSRYHFWHQNDRNLLQFEMGKGTITTAQTRFHLDGSVSGRNTLDRPIPAYHLESTKTGRSSLDRATPAEIIHLKSTTFGRGALDCATLAKIFYHVEGTTSGRN